MRWHIPEHTSRENTHSREPGGDHSQLLLYCRLFTIPCCLSPTSSLQQFSPKPAGTKLRHSFATSLPRCSSETDLGLRHRSWEISLLFDAKKSGFSFQISSIYLLQPHSCVPFPARHIIPNNSIRINFHSVKPQILSCSVPFLCSCSCSWILVTEFSWQREFFQAKAEFSFVHLIPGVGLSAKTEIRAFPCPQTHPGHQPDLTQRCKLL